jgi:hypothetical protein
MNEKSKAEKNVHKNKEQNIYTNSLCNVSKSLWTETKVRRQIKNKTNIIYLAATVIQICDKIIDFLIYNFYGNLLKKRIIADDNLSFFAPLVASLLQRHFS